MRCFTDTGEVCLRQLPARNRQFQIIDAGIGIDASRWSSSSNPFERGDLRQDSSVGLGPQPSRIHADLLDGR
jgi:hypothetical protein